MERSELPPTSLAAKWKRSRQLVELGNKLGSLYPEWDIAYDLEVDVLLGPISTIEDVVAKLRAIQLAFIDGVRSDGADARALCQTIRWLHALACAEQASDSRAA
jgi:hypothetical protein